MHQKLNNQREILKTAVDIGKKSIAVNLSDETEVVRYSWSDGKYYLKLLHGKENVDLSRKDILSVFINHDTEELPIGKFENVRIEDGKLKAEAMFDEEDPDSLRIFNKLARGFLQSFSVGIDIMEKVLDKEVNGVKYYNATKWAITEASIVGIPAIPSAKVGLSGVNPASAKIENSNEGESVEYTKEKFEALTNTHAEALKTAKTDAIATERKRVSEILALHGDDKIKKDAIEKGLSAGDCAIELNKVISVAATNFEQAASEVSDVAVSNSQEELTEEQQKEAEALAALDKLEGDK